MIAEAASADGLASQLAQSTWLLEWQRQRSDAGVSRSFGEWQPMAAVRSQGTPAGLLPLTLQLGSSSRLNLAYGLAAADQNSRDPIRVGVQGLGFSTNFGAVKSESQLYFSRPSLDGGAAATLVGDLGRSTAREGVDASRLQEGRAIRQSLGLSAGSIQLTGRFQEIDRSFALPQRFLSAAGSGETAKLLQELAQQSGTRRTALGMTAGLSKGWKLTGGFDALDDGAGRIHRQEVGIASDVLQIKSLHQDVGAQFAGFNRFGDAEVQKMAAQKGVKRSALQWALAPGKQFGIQGSTDTHRDASGAVDARSLALHLGAFQATERRRAVAGFKTVGALEAGDQALAKLGQMALREQTAALALGGKTRLAFASDTASDTGGRFQDERYEFASPTLVARARFRSIDAGFAGAKGLASVDKRFAGLEQLCGQRERAYDLDYVGSTWFGLRNHYSQTRAMDADATETWQRQVFSNTMDLNLGRTSAQIHRLQSDTAQTSGETLRHRLERYRLRHNFQKESFLLAEHTQQTDHDAEGERKVLQTNRLQGKLDVASLFRMEGDRVERYGTDRNAEYEDRLVLSRQFGKMGVTWNFRDHQNAEGEMDVQKLSLTGTLRKGLQLTGSRETTRTQAAPDDSTTVAPAQHNSDTRATLTQALGKAGKLSLSYAQLTAADAMRSREYASRLETPIGRLRLTADFANRQAAGAPTVVIQGFTLADEAKERRLTWSCHYRHRSAAAGTEKETKGWIIGYNGAGARPLKLTASYLRNAEAKDGKVTPGKQTRVEMNTGISRRLTLGASYINNVDENARKADERFQITLSGPIGADEKLSLLGTTQRLFEPEGTTDVKRTRVETLRLEYSHGLNESQAFSIGADLCWREYRGQTAGRHCEYRSDIRWQRSF